MWSKQLLFSVKNKLRCTSSWDLFKDVPGTTERQRKKSRVKKVGDSNLQCSASSGSTKWIDLLARSGSINRIHLPLSLYELCAVYICMSISSCHTKMNELLDTSLGLLSVYLTEATNSRQGIRTRDLLFTWQALNHCATTGSLCSKNLNELFSRAAKSKWTTAGTSWWSEYRRPTSTSRTPPRRTLSPTTSSRY